MSRAQRLRLVVWLDAADMTALGELCRGLHVDPDEAVAEAIRFTNALLVESKAIAAEEGARIADVLRARQERAS